jgi:Rieske Fe-S protein
MSTCDRRTVLQVGAVLCGGGLLAACGGGGGTERQVAAPEGATSTPPGGGGTPAAGGGLRVSLVQLSTVPVGGAVAASALDGSKVLITRPSEDEAVAFSAVCPHEGCTVAPDDAQFSCPCHGSQFTLSGEVKRGPAQTGLRPFAVQVVDGQVLPA